MFSHEGIGVFVWVRGVEPGHHVVGVRKTAERPQDGHLLYCRADRLVQNRDGVDVTGGLAQAGSAM